MKKIVSTLYYLILLVDNLVGKFISTLLVVFSIGKINKAPRAAVLLLFFIFVTGAIRVAVNPSTVAAEVYLILCLLLMISMFTVGKTALKNLVFGVITAGYIASTAIIVMFVAHKLGFNIYGMQYLLRYNEVNGLIDSKYTEFEIYESLNERISFGNPSDYGLLAFASYFIVVASSKRNNIPLLLLTLIALTISQSRSYMFGVLLLAFVCLSIRAKLMASIFLTVASLLLFNYYNEYLIDYWRLDQILNSGSSLRITIYELVFDELLKNINSMIFGVGYGNMKNILEAVLGFRTTTESAFLTLIGSYGVFGFCIIIFLFKKLTSHFIGPLSGAGLVIFLYLILISFVQPYGEYIISYITIPIIFRTGVTLLGSGVKNQVQHRFH